MKPSSPIFFTTAAGNFPSASVFAAIGATSLFAKSRAASWIIRCCSESSNMSAALERRGALLDEGLHPFLLVVGREEPGDGLRLERERISEVHRGAAAHQLLRGGD